MTLSSGSLTSVLVLRTLFYDAVRALSVEKIDRLLERDALLGPPVFAGQLAVLAMQYSDLIYFNRPIP